MSAESSQPKSTESSASGEKSKDIVSAGPSSPQPNTSGKINKNAKCLPSVENSDQCTDD